MLCGSALWVYGRWRRRFSRPFTEGFILDCTDNLLTVDVRLRAPSLMPTGISATALLPSPLLVFYTLFPRRCPIPWPRRDQRGLALTSIAFVITTSSGSKIHIARRRRKGLPFAVRKAVIRAEQEQIASGDDDLEGIRERESIVNQRV